MRVRGNVGPALLSANRNSSSLVYIVLIILTYLLFTIYFENIPHNLELVLFLFGSLRSGHILHRLSMLCQERNVLSRLYQESNTMFCLKYAMGDLLVSLVLFLIAALHYFLQYRGNENPYFSEKTFLCFCTIGFMIQYTKRLHPADKKIVARNYELDIAHGLAFFYYCNYLTVIRDTFQRRVREFSNEHEVPVSRKLFILVPHSCKVKDYVDENEHEIMRARELPPFRLDVAGIRERVYNITLYEFSPKDWNDDNLFAIEYAQPLKQLHELYTEGSITEGQMQEERNNFFCDLNEYLHDGNDSFRTFILVPFNDDDNLERVIKAADQS